jgi:hypothetical protein
MGTSYEKDAAIWAEEQGALLRAGKLSEIDFENVAEEIEAMGRSERRELASRMVVLLTHLLKWQFQPGRRGESWRNTIFEQRNMLKLLLKDSPSLKPKLSDPEWLSMVWNDVVASASNETGLTYKVFPESCLWSIDDVLTYGFFPDQE